MSTPHGERMKTAYNLTSRERRRMTIELMNAQEAIEKAQEALEALIVKFNQAGMSYESIGGALGQHGSTIRGRILRATGADDSQ